MLIPTIYADIAHGRWEYTTYSDGQRVALTEVRARDLIRRDGYRLVNAAEPGVRQHFPAEPIGRGRSK